MWFFKPNIEKLSKRQDVNGLIKALLYEDEGVRKNAAGALGQIGDSRAVEPLIGLLREELPLSVLKSAAIALGKLGNSSAEDSLVALLQDKRSAVRESASRALGMLGKPAGLIAVLKEEALAKIVQPDVERYITALKNGGHAVANNAVAMLEKIGKPAVKGLIASLKDKEFYMKRALFVANDEPSISYFPLENVVKLIVKIGDAHAAVEPLLAALKQGGMREAAALGLQRCGWEPSNQLDMIYYLMGIGKWDKVSEFGESATAPLLDALKSTDYFFVDYSMLDYVENTFVQIGKPAVEPLIAALNDKDSYAKRYQQKNGNPSVSYFLIKYVAEALAKIGDTRAVEPLIKILKDGNADVREIAANALMKMSDARIVEPFIEALKNGNAKKVQFLAARALGKMGDARAVAPLVATLQEGDDELLFYTITAIGELCDARAVEPLIKVMKGKKMQRLAAEALGKIGDVRAVEPLIKMLKNGEEVAVAAEALGNIGDVRAIEPLSEVRQDVNVGYRVAQAIQKIKERQTR